MTKEAADFTAIFLPHVPEALIGSLDKSSSSRWSLEVSTTILSFFVLDRDPDIVSTRVLGTKVAARAVFRPLALASYAILY